MHFFILVSLFFIAMSSIASRAEISKDSISANSQPQGNASADNANSKSPPILDQKPHLIVFPMVYYTPETSFAGGVINIYNIDEVAPGRISQVQLVGAYTSKQQTIVALTPKLYFNSGKNEVFGNLNYSYYPNKYYGQGDFHLDNPENYTENVLKSSIGATHNFNTFFFGRLQATRNQFKILKTESGGNLETQLNANGFSTLEINGLAFGIDYDSRDFPLSPTSGYYLKNQIAFQQAKDPNLDQNKNFQTYEMDWRIYSIVKQKYILANQFYFGHLSDRDLPFQTLLSIGGNHSMRGYYNGQYRNQDLLMNQNEIRGSFTNKFGWDSFISIAKLGSSMNSIQYSTTHLSAGGGINYLLDPKSRVKIRLNFGVSKENSGVYFVLGESF